MVTDILMKPERIVAYQHVLLTKKPFPVPAFAYPIRKRLTKKGPDPYPEDADMKDLRMCAEETLVSSTPAAYRPPEVWAQHKLDGHMPKLPDCSVCVQEHGSVVRRFSSTTNSFNTLHLDTGYWGDLRFGWQKILCRCGSPGPT